MRSIRHLSTVSTGLSTFNGERKLPSAYLIFAFNCDPNRQYKCVFFNTIPNNSLYPKPL